MKRASAILSILILLLLPCPLPAAEESLDGAEKDLAGVLRELEAISSELDRLQDIAAAPRASTLRVEIHGKGGLPAPVSCRLLLQRNVEEEREWSRAEREAFAGGAPLVLQVPLLPGTYSGRIEIAHPSWKATPASDFQASVRKGETVLLKFLLATLPGKPGPVLSRTAEK